LSQEGFVPGETDISLLKREVQAAPWYSRSAQDTAAELGVDPAVGVDTDQFNARLAEYGPNELPTEAPPSLWVVARGQLSNPMNIMLLIVGVASFAIGQIPTGVVITALVTFNVVMGSNQELKARASVDALAQLQVPHAHVWRAGRVEEVESTQLVPGDIMSLEAGDIVPADGRILSSATLELQEAALRAAPRPRS
jgi:P-type Ca2+ transporter type 2C